MQAESLPGPAEESADTPNLMDLFTPGFADDPHPAYHAMQTECPVQRSAGLFGGYSVNGACEYRLKASSGTAPSTPYLVFLTMTARPEKLWPEPRWSVRYTVGIFGARC